MRNVLSLLLLCGLLVTACAGTVDTTHPAPPPSPADELENAPDFRRLVIDGEPGSNGIYDPALAYTEDGTVGWLAYTSADGEIVAGSELLHTHIARTTDGGATWSYVQRVNETGPASVTLPNGQRQDGLWHYEVPSLVHDPGDMGREWKLFTHKIFWSREGGRNPAQSLITLRSAADPAGAWSAEVDLFGSGLPLPPADDPKVNLNELDRALEANLVYSEPGAIASDGVLYVSVTGLVATGSAGVFLFSSPDHGATWSYVGMLFGDADAERLGAKALDGSSLVSVGRRVYVLVVPIKSRDYPRLMNGGTYVFEVTDLTKAEVATEPLLFIPPQDLESADHGAGQATYDPGNIAGGIMVSQISLADRPAFAQIFNTGLQLPDAPAR